MKAKIVKFFRPDEHYHCQAITENNIALAFGITGDERLELDEILEIDLPNLIANQRVTRVSDGKVIRIQMRSNDMHDLNLPMVHGTMRIPNEKRLKGGA